MKKFIALLICVILVVGSMGCSGGASQEQQIEVVTEQNTPDSNKIENDGIPAQSDITEQVSAPVSDMNAEVTLEEQLLVDEKNIKITAKGLKADSFYGPEIQLLIENNTDKDLTVQTRASSVNGYMVDASMSAEVAAGKKANDSLTFYSSDLELCGIETIAEAEWMFHIFTSDGWDTYLDTNLVQVETSAASEYNYQYDDSGTEIYNDNSIRIISKGIDRAASIYGPGLQLYIENASSQSITIQVRNASVNGFMVDTIMSEEVSAGKRACTDITFEESSLNDNGIETITSAEFSFHIFTTDGWDTIVDTPSISLTF